MAEQTGIPFSSGVQLSPPFRRTRDGEAVADEGLVISQLTIKMRDTAGIRYVLRTETGEVSDVALRGWDVINGADGALTGYTLTPGRELADNGVTFEAVGSLGVPPSLVNDDPAPGGWGGATVSNADGAATWISAPVVGSVGHDPASAVAADHTVQYDWPLDEVATQNPNTVLVTYTGAYDRVTLRLPVGAVNTEYGLSLNSYLWLPLNFSSIGFTGRAFRRL